MKLDHKPYLGMLVLCAAFIAASCTMDDNATSQQSAQAVKVQENSRITLAVRQQLDKDEMLWPLKIDVQTSDGIVSLRGNVPSQLVADRAEQVAEGVAGVRTVRSFLRVLSAENS